MDTLCPLRDTGRRKRPEKWRTNSWFILQDNAPAHRSGLVKDFLTENYVTTMEQDPNSPDLVVADTDLFPRLKSALKGGCLDAADFNNNAVEEVKRLSQIYFQEFFQNVYSGWKKCNPVVAQEECFEGNIA
jgi:hypothetical protein